MSKCVSEHDSLCSVGGMVLRSGLFLSTSTAMPCGEMPSGILSHKNSRDLWGYRVKVGKARTEGTRKGNKKKSYTKLVRRILRELLFQRKETHTSRTRQRTLQSDAKLWKIHAFELIACQIQNPQISHAIQLLRANLLQLVHGEIESFQVFEIVCEKNEQSVNH